MISTIKQVKETLQEINKCTNKIKVYCEETMQVEEDDCNCEMLCESCGEKLFELLDWCTDVDEKGVHPTNTVTA